MYRKFTVGFALAASLLATSAGAQNVASTSQKGSVLKFPYIDIQPGDTTDTIIHISNDSNEPVQVKCYYVNERKGRRDFAFKLTGKATATWSVYRHTGTINVAAFPNNGVYPGRATIGELTCFAVNLGVDHQIRWNHLSGIATVVKFTDADAAQTRQAFEYNAYAFKARANVAEGATVGTAGHIPLDGINYDACPSYLITEFGPGGATLASRPSVTYIDNDLAVASCNEDLRQDFIPHFTKLQFTVWNAQENKFTGAYICSNSVRQFGLDADDAPADAVGFENFSYDILGTTDARFEVRGVASTQCPASESSGLLAVLTTSFAIFPDALPNESTELGITLRGAGAAPGYIRWDPNLPPEERR